MSYTFLIGLTLMIAILTPVLLISAWREGTRRIETRQADEDEK